MTSPPTVPPIVDQVIPVLLVPQCIGFATGETIDQVSALELGGFDGSELVAETFMFDTELTIAQILSRCTSVPVAAALSHRGLIVLNTAGRLGITTGYGRVVEPIGRQYAMVLPLPGRYVSAWDTGRVVFTMGSPV